MLVINSCQLTLVLKASLENSRQTLSEMYEKESMVNLTFSSVSVSPQFTCRLQCRGYWWYSAQTPGVSFYCFCAQPGFSVLSKDSIHSLSLTLWLPEPSFPKRYKAESTWELHLLGWHLTNDIWEQTILWWILYSDFLSGSRLKLLSAGLCPGGHCCLGLLPFPLPSLPPSWFPLGALL